MAVKAALGTESAFYHPSMWNQMAGIGVSPRMSPDGNRKLFEVAEGGLSALGSAGILVANFADNVDTDWVVFTLYKKKKRV